MAGLAQPPAECPKIIFSYDASGNRVQRKLIITNCDEQRLKNNEPAAPAFHANAFPNPPNDKVNIEMENIDGITTSAVSLYDLNGKEVYSLVTPDLKLQIDVSKLAEGTYLLKITRGKEYKTFNVLKN